MVFRRLWRRLKKGFTLAEVLIATAIIAAISIGISQLLVHSSRFMLKSSLMVTRQNLQNYMTSLVNNQKARCNSASAGGNITSCYNMCEYCESGSGICTWGGSPSGVPNCHNYGLCSSSGVDGTNNVGGPANTSLKDFQTVTSDAAHSRPGGDGLPGLSLIMLGGNKVTDGGVPCGGTYLAADSSCRWYVNITYQPDANDTMRYYLTLNYSPNESDDVQKIPNLSWQITVPMDDFCPALTTNYCTVAPSSNTLGAAYTCPSNAAAPGQGTCPVGSITTFSSAQWHTDCGDMNSYTTSACTTQIASPAASCFGATWQFTSSGTVPTDDGICPDIRTALTTCSGCYLNAYNTWTKFTKNTTVWDYGVCKYSYHF